MLLFIDIYTHMRKSFNLTCLILSQYTLEYFYLNSWLEHEIIRCIIILYPKIVDWWKNIFKNYRVNIVRTKNNNLKILKTII